MITQYAGQVFNPTGAGLSTPSPEPEAVGSPHHFNTFRLGGQEKTAMVEIPNNSIDPSRQKRPHQKSRRGCFNCRRRRVKCDEKSPRCSHCTRRHDHCEWRSSSKHYDTGKDLSVCIRRLRPPDPGLPFHPTAGDDSIINTLHMELFHHFETHTRHTLSFDTVWQEAMKLSFGFESLMHAILCLSAKHLAYLQPENPEYGMTATKHFSQMLHLFQQDLKNRKSTSDIDCYLTTATLLSYIVWDDIEVLPSDGDSVATANILEDRVFWIGGGTLYMFMSTNFSILRKQSLFLPHITYSPRIALCKAVGLTSATIDSYQSFFDYRHPLTVDQLSIPDFFSPIGAQNAKEEDLTAYFVKLDGVSDTVEAYRRIVARLCVFLSFLPEMQNPDKEKAYQDSMPDLARFIFSFPVVSFRESQVLTRRRNPKWWLVLYHFYRAVTIILPGCFWWAHQRSRFMESSLKKLLLRECAKAEKDSVSDMEA
ncbi:hypothetical protein B0J13DRAFT_455756 [Dactylonectria estremocensis]|uniref:Zn(2)-C6 fungal-type domain-containing protein n=1 Tax=Dactylonectria estremocensis TaxID=1079267 RepID=A0A9P9IL94_9HYPO|nr:hypothetical protein B0J13DRAFT_455756 [Dactylonectria estremocensis]